MDGPATGPGFPLDSAPRYLLRDRDRIYGEPFPATVHSMEIHQVLTAPQSPWQNAYCGL
jgi:putative transposase